MKNGNGVDTMRSIEIEYFEDPFGDIDEISLSIEDFEVIVEQALLNNNDFFKAIADNILSVKKRHNSEYRVLN